MQHLAAILGIGIARPAKGAEDGWIAERYRDARFAEIQGDYQEAITLYDEIVACDPAYLDAHERRTQVEIEQRRRQTFEAGKAAYTAGHWTEVIALCHQLQEEEPAYRATEVGSILGMALYEEALRLVDGGQCNVRHRRGQAAEPALSLS